MHDCGVGISMSIAWAGECCEGAPCYADGQHGGPAMVFGNVIATTQQAGIRMAGPPGAAHDHIDGVEIFGNTLYRTATLDDTLGVGYADGMPAPYLHDSAITMVLTGAQLAQHRYLNNLIVDSRPAAADGVALTLRSQAPAFASGHDHYADSRASQILVRYVDDAGVATELPWDSLMRPDGYGEGDAVGAPHLVDPTNGDFRLTDASTAIIGHGVAVGPGIATTITIDGHDHPLSHAFALGPGTDWSTTPATIDARWRTTSGWDVGAYTD